MSHPRILPSGTLLTVQLDDSLSADKVRAGDAFTASVAAPLTIDGDTLIERGTAVTGRVESAQSQADRPGLIPGSGYFRLTLNAITVEGRQLALQTSSLFARGTLPPLNVSSPASPPDLRLDSLQVQKGRRLTFRLTAPVALDDPNSMANRQSPDPSPNKLAGFLPLLLFRMVSTAYYFPYVAETKILPGFPQTFPDLSDVCPSQRQICPPIVGSK